jgi:hypothetical protein
MDLCGAPAIQFVLNGGVDEGVLKQQTEGSWRNEDTSL